MSASLIKSITAQSADMLALLKDLVLIQSGTYNKTGVDHVGCCIASQFQNSVFSVETKAHDKYGDMLLVSSPACGRHDNILLVGHMDTVFPADTHFTDWHEGNNKVIGPGVIDMKGGLVVGIYALKALAAEGLIEHLPIKFLFNSEEEVGSPASDSWIEAQARRSAMAFVLECGGMDGQIVTGRKGRLGLTIEVAGQAGHAATITKNKASAILALAHHIVALEALNTGRSGLTVNVGQIQGGMGPNSVPEKAWAAVDVRYLNTKEKTGFQQSLDDIITRPVVQGTHTSVETVSDRPPMVQSDQNRALYKVAAQQAELLNIAIKEEVRAGASDANLIAAQDTPVLDGLGPIGDCDHSDREYMFIDSLVQRCQLLTLTILDCWQRFQTGNLF